MKTIKNILIVGVGNVATHLAQGFRKANLSVTLTGRSHKKNKKIAKLLGIGYTESINSYDKPVDLYLIAVNDTAISSVVKEIPSDAQICYTSGSIDLANFPTENIGVFYPLQSFSKDRSISLEKVPFFIEAKNQFFEQQLFDLANKLSSKVHLANSETRGHLHIAAVFVNNFTNHLFVLASDYLNANGQHIDALKPLMEETVKKLEYISPSEAQTGPARRNDFNVIKKHEALLEGKSAQEVYRIISNSIINYYKEEK